MPNERPAFPMRAVITGGMPYGNKSLHFGHVGGVFVPADCYARFLRDRIGKDNVVFVSGTDCYGSPLAEAYRAKKEAGEITGSIEDFCAANHEDQKQTLADYGISLNLFAASGLGRSKEIHADYTDEFIRTLYANGWLEKLATSQFYDTKHGVFLNGRQVVGRCPVEGCKSEKGYADECDLGHQYMPADLIAPRSTLSGETPEMRDVVNWYFKLPDFLGKMKEYIAAAEQKETMRPLVASTTKEFLTAPVIYVKNDLRDAYADIAGSLPPHAVIAEENKPSFVLEFAKIGDREAACEKLSAAGIRYRTGKTLVPFRLTGNIEWGVPAPSLEGEEALTVWVWPESLWAPISFTKTYLESCGKDPEAWKDFWLSRDCGVYQFIGQDNIYFYGVAQMAMFMAMQGAGAVSADPPDGELPMTTLVANNHILFLDKKASSSGKIKPPMAAELLNHYTPEQLRAHFLGLGLSLKSVSFQPKPFNPKANPTDRDPVLKEGSLFTGVLNRLARSCFYTAQKYCGGKLPQGEVSPAVIEEANAAILTYERQMYTFEFHNVMNLLDAYIRGANKYWAREMGIADKADDTPRRLQVLVDAFHMLRVAAVLSHPVVPFGTEMIREYLGFTERFWDWEHIFDTVYAFADSPDHTLKELPPKTDFFAPHPAQFT
ncbi:MAG: class I tRNA ligase family protein [Oscillospiraceae bacterium]|jgi:methionyl-tRNA synthetase|nr:class I tRNA ligase family protein [Oscillospiraceae bacterium]